ncbi:uncharacterized protein LOC126319895 [Schistocerca gregaria]|uniref:uncharacterized protein LOC126319895 n=1 Tax=Schistocerca gregaria TaxID=7010 RepID=UPI00211E48ED|nr:uncharacterized protein LOC126319895 [Schistocerca gregaria]
MGVEKDDAELERLLAQEPQRTVILFPSVDSIFIREYLERHTEKRTERVQNVKLNVIVIDATWNKARGLAAALPKHIPRIRLERPPAHSSSKMRKQGCVGRVTTAEGLAYLFKELHEDASTHQNLLYNLQIRCRAINASSGSSHGQSDSPVEAE